MEVEMADTSVVNALREFLKGEFPKHASRIAAMSADDSLRALEIVDSVGMLTIATFIEVKWEMKVPEEDFRPDQFDTLNTIAALVASAPR